jgi:hypothetical protein
MRETDPDRIQYSRMFWARQYGMGFCQAGNHVVEKSWMVDAQTWCPEHLPPGLAADPPRRGECKVGRIHKADAVWWVPVMGVYVCKRHLATIVREVIRRGEFGKP